MKKTIIHIIKAPITKDISAFKGQCFVVFLINIMKTMPPGMQDKKINKPIFISFFGLILFNWGINSQLKQFIFPGKHFSDFF